MAGVSSSPSLPRTSAQSGRWNDSPPSTVTTRRAGARDPFDDSTCSSWRAIVGKQIPYLVSGGIGGVFFSVLGAYFLGTQELRSDSGRLDRLEHMVEDLHAALLSRPDAPTIVRHDEQVESANGSRSPARRVVAVEGGESFHRSDCALVRDKDGEELTPATARKRGLRPCPVCEPAPAAATS